MTWQWWELSLCASTVAAQNGHAPLLHKDEGFPSWLDRIGAITPAEEASGFKVRGAAHPLKVCQLLLG
jgi:hypothetical protein